MDALGALLTSVLLFGVLAPLSSYFGIPKQVFYLLSGIAFCLFTYSSICSILIKKNWNPYLKIIIVLNFMYLMVYIFLIINHTETISEMGWIYFSLEILVIGFVITLEIKTLKKLNPIH